MLISTWSWVQNGTRLGPYGLPLGNTPPWWSGEPNGGTSEQCISMTCGSRWHDNPCTSGGAFAHVSVCELDKTLTNWQSRAWRTSANTAQGVALCPATHSFGVTQCASPVPLPTTPPTTAPTSLPTLAPTGAPTNRPTASPTRHPTPHVCRTQLHPCDLFTTYCQADSSGGASFSCICRSGYMETSESPYRCVVTPSPSETPTVTTDAPSTSPTSTPTASPSVHPSSSPSRVPSSNPTYAPIAAPALAPHSPDTSTGTGGSTAGTNMIIFVVVVMCAVGIIGLLVLLQKRGNGSSHDALSRERVSSGGNSFANPLYGNKPGAGDVEEYVTFSDE